MNYKLIITEEANNDVEEAMAWYEEQKKGLGKKYLVTVTDCIRLIVKNPYAFATIYYQIKRANTKKFPDSVYYSIEDITVTIIAVIHNSRNEDKWKNRLTNE